MNSHESIHVMFQELILRPQYFPMAQNGTTEKQDPMLRARLLRLQVLEDSLHSRKMTRVGDGF